MTRSLQERLRVLDFRTRHRILGRAVVLVTEELNHGTKHQSAREETDVEEEVGMAYEAAIYHNKFKRDIAMNDVLRAILGREELRAP